MSLKMQMKMIIRLFVDILKTAWEVVENCYTRDPKKTGKSLMLGWLLQRNFLGKAVRRWRRARAILSNLGRIKGEEDVEISSDEDSDNDEGDLGNDESDDNEQESNCVIDQNRNAVRFKGKQEREILMRAMTDWMLWLILKKWIFVSLICSRHTTLICSRHTTFQYFPVVGVVKIVLF